MQFKQARRREEKRNVVNERQEATESIYRYDGRVLLGRVIGLTQEGTASGICVTSSGWSWRASEYERSSKSRRPALRMHARSMK